MNNNILLIGATGLTGNAFLRTAGEKAFNGSFLILTRKEIPHFQGSRIFKQYIYNFASLPELPAEIKPDRMISMLGTTITKAGSQDNFRKIDYNIPLEIASKARQRGCRFFILLSSVGADPDSKIFYSRIKGELERDLLKLDFEGTHILRPSLLLGDRQESRPGEKFARIFAPLYSPFLPYRYKPVQVSVLSEKMYNICLNPKSGVHYYEGKDIFK